MKHMQARLSYITLGVANFGQMYVFYKSLGFPVYKVSKQSKDPFAMFDMGSLILALYPKILLERQAGCAIGEANRAMALSLNVADKKQVDAFLCLAKSKDATLTQLPFRPDWGGCCGYFKDPEGNLWEVVWHENYPF